MPKAPSFQRVLLAQIGFDTAENEPYPTRVFKYRSEDVRVAVAVELARGFAGPLHEVTLRLVDLGSAHCSKKPPNFPRARTVYRYFVSLPTCHLPTLRSLFPPRYSQAGGGPTGAQYLALNAAEMKKYTCHATEKSTFRRKHALFQYRKCIFHSK